MFTLAQIEAIHARLGKAETLFEYMNALRAIGAKRYESHVTDGHTEYFGAGGEQISSPPAHEPFSVAELSDREGFLHHLKLHEQGKTSYVEMSRGLAACGIEKWTVDTEKMTMTYSDRAGHELLVETIK